jgi:hypothetical protein
MTLTTSTHLLRKTTVRGAKPVREPLSPQRKWKTITVATLLLVPAYWMLLAGLVAVRSAAKGAPDPAAAMALGLAVIPFVFLVLAVMSGRARWPGAVARAMGLAILVGIPVSALAGDAITGIVAGVGAGGCVALRRDDPHSLRTRALAVAFAALYTLVLVRSVSALALLPAPVLPLTAIGIADHLSERRRVREEASA